MEQLGRAGRADEPRNLRVGLGVGGVGELGGDALVVDRQAIGGDELMFEEGRARGLADAGDRRSGPEAAEGPPCQGAEPGRARLEVGADQAAEGVEVVAGDDRPARRQGQRELGITMIDDVIDVERLAAGEAAEVAGIVDEPVQDPVGVPRQARQPRPGDAAQAMAVRRADPRRLDLAAVAAREVLRDHLGHEVHARPPLLGVVGDDRDAEAWHGGRHPIGQAGAVG